MNSQIRNEKGFTFLEIMVAVAILSIALIAALRAQSQSLSIAGDSIRSTKVVLMAREKMAEYELDIQSGGNLEEGKTDGTFDKYPGYRWEIEVKEAPNPFKNLQIEGLKDVSPEGFKIEALKDVILTILWKEGSIERRYSIETLLLKDN